MEHHDKEVFFDQYCKKCTHYNEPDTSEACNECLTQPTNEDSHKPVGFDPKNGGAK